MRLRIVESTDDRAAELLAAVADEAGAAGAEVSRGRSTSPAARDEVCLFVPLAADADPADLPAVPARAIAICVAHPGTAAFDVSTQVAGCAAAAVDLTAAGALEQRRRGVRAERFRVGLGRRWSTARPPLAGERDCELLFVGRSTPRRESVLAANAPALAARRSAIHLGSAHSGSAVLPAAADRAALFAGASVVLDIHPFRPHGIDWTVALQAIGAGAVPVFEHVLDPYPLVPQEHFVVANGEGLATVAGGLLDDRDRLRALARAGHALVCDQLPMGPAVDRLLTIAETVARSPRARVRNLARGAPPRRPRPELPTPDGDPRARKRAALEVIARRRGERERELGQRGLSLEPSRVHETPVWAAARATVAICVPVHEDGESALRALESAAGCEGVDVELLVHDDGSSDGSLELVTTWLERRPHLPARVTASPVNRGPGAARNAMLAGARAQYAFMLDADNLVFPRALAQLVDPLEQDPHAVFAYGLLERRRDGRSVGVLSAGPWEPARLRSGNYIDAMALLRREAVLEIGGFGESLRLYGWEDFDLWCRVAELGRHARYVPTFIGRYHERSDSMLSLASIDASDAVHELRERYPRLAPDIPG